MPISYKLIEHYHICTVLFSGDMDSGIVEGFQNLHVLPDCEAVDSLTRELATMLDESSPRLHRKAHGRHGDSGLTSGCIIKHPVKKRRCKKRKSAMITGPSVGANMSEGLDGGFTSDSGGGTLTRHKFMDCVSRLSDSDNISINHSSAFKPVVRVTTNTLVESDSVTENWSPLRPQRRRRHMRRMAVDEICETSVPSVVQRAADSIDLLAGKRKRGVKDNRSDNNSFDFDFTNNDVSHNKSQNCSKMQ